jgi:hypothetical protein
MQRTSKNDFMKWMLVILILAIVLVAGCTRTTVEVTSGTGIIPTEEVPTGANVNSVYGKCNSATAKQTYEEQATSRQECIDICMKSYKADDVTHPLAPNQYFPLWTCWCLICEGGSSTEKSTQTSTQSSKQISQTETKQESLPIIWETTEIYNIGYLIDEEGGDWYEINCIPKVYMYDNAFSGVLYSDGTSHTGLVDGVRQNIVISGYWNTSSEKLAIHINQNETKVICYKHKDFWRFCEMYLMGNEIWGYHLK